MTEQLANAISCHAWNRDQSLIALSPNNNEMHIYATNGNVSDASKWERKWVLDKHGGPVSGIDWAPITNQIVSCGHDRNAYVWRYDEKDNDWKPTLVILRINRAATAVKWSPNENKFAVASGAKCVPVCYFEASNDWWICKVIKKHRSTVLSLDWCVNNKFIVTGGADMKCRVFSAYLEGIDPSEDDGFGEVFPKQHEFGEVLAEFDSAQSWVHSVAWSPGGFRLAFAGHGSNVSFVQILAGSTPIVQTVNFPNLPFLDIRFLSDNSLVAAGFDMNPAVFEVTGGTEAEPFWSYKQSVDKKDTASSSQASQSSFGATRAAFSATVNQGVQFGKTVEESSIWTKHKNIISNIFVFPPAEFPATKFSTAGLDGRVVVWDVAPLALK